jgi:hypothetical protein
MGTKVPKLVQAVADLARCTGRGLLATLRWAYSACLDALDYLYRRLWPTGTTGRLFCWNFVTLILVGVAVASWLLLMTDWFEYFASLIGLGGALTWLAFVTKLLPDDEGKAIQKGLFGFFLGGRYAWAVYLFLLAAAGLVTASLGTIQCESAQAGADYQVAVYRNGESPPSMEDRDRLPATGRLRFVRPLPWWRPGRFTVSVFGLPASEVTLRPWWDRKPLRVPYTFLERPVVLVGADGELFGRIQEDAKLKYAYWMVVTLNEQEFRLEKPYRGEAVWVGCDGGDGVELPKAVLEDWRQPLKEYPDQAPLLLSPTALAELVAPGDRDRLRGLLGGGLRRIQVSVEWTLEADREEYVKTAVIPVRQVRTPENLVQTVLMKGP